MKKEPTDIRFFRKVEKTDYCWNWIGYLNNYGYGCFWLNEGIVKTHRYSYEYHYGSFDKSLNVLHKCDNPRCVNPEHLFLGTHEDNMKDMHKKNRNTKVWLGKSGKLHNKSKPFNGVNLESGIELTFLSYRTCAVELGIKSYSSISQVVNGKEKSIKNWFFYRD